MATKADTQAVKSELARQFAPSLRAPLSVPRPALAEVAEFVRESNAIEGIYGIDGPAWHDHIRAAQMVWEQSAPNWLLNPRGMHSQIMKNYDRAFPGEYRSPRPHLNFTGGVMVGGDVKMPWQEVPAAMKALTAKARAFKKSPPHDDGPLWDLHYEFERIHPFFDGNGRVGRLWLNALRQVCGFEWAIVCWRPPVATKAAVEAVMNSRCWLVGSYGVCIGFGRWNRLGWAFAHQSGAIRLGPLGVLWAKAEARQ